MALRSLIINKKLVNLREELKNLDFKALEIRKTKLEKAIEEAETEEDLKAVEEETDEVEEERETLEEEKQKLIDEIAKLEAELKALEDKEIEIEEEEDRSDEKMDKIKEIRSGVNAYIRKDSKNRNFTTVDGGALIPNELLAAEKKPEDKVDLGRLAKTVKVTSGAGTYPVIGKTDKVMNTVAELEANPKLANPIIDEVTYKIETYRGYIPISQEMIDDADYDVAGLVAEELNNQELNTKNAAVAGVLKTATAKPAKGVDGLKKVINVDLKRAYKRQAVLSASLFNELDITKDRNGRYLLQDDITVESGKRLLGMAVEVVDDTLIGTAEGDLVGFIGDVEAHTVLFDRVKASIKWVDNNVYGQLLAGFVRFQAKKTDADAGFYITYTADVQA